MVIGYKTVFVIKSQSRLLNPVKANLPKVLCSKSEYMFAPAIIHQLKTEYLRKNVHRSGKHCLVWQSHMASSYSNASQVLVPCLHGPRTEGK